MRRILLALALLLPGHAWAAGDGLTQGPFNGGTIANPLTAPSVNATGATAYQIGGKTVLKTGTDCCQPVLLGPDAGVSIIGTNSENTFLGNESGQFVTTGTGDTGVGEHTMGFETTGIALVAVGQDAMRNSVGVNSAVAVGAHASEVYFGQKSNFLGYYSGAGNSASVLIGGTATNGDVVTLTFTSTQIPGGASTAAYTVAGGNTPTVIAAGLAAAVMANSTLTNANVFANVDAFTSPGVIRVIFNGTSTIGTILTVTSGVSGSATETVAITGGVTAGSVRNNGFGFSSFQAYKVTTSYDNNAFGAYTLANCVTCQQTNVMGEEAGMQLTTGILNVFIGDKSGTLATTTYDSTFVGAATGSACTTCRTDTLIGYGAGAATLTNAISVIYITDGAGTCDGNTSNVFKVCLSTGVPFTITNGFPSSASIASFAGALQVGSITTLTVANGEFGIAKTTASGTAPGAAGVKLAAVCGTNAGTAKLIMSAGTSGTAVTVLDNVGAGVTGC